MLFNAKSTIAMAALVFSLIASVSEAASLRSSSANTSEGMSRNNHASDLRGQAPTMQPVRHLMTADAYFKACTKAGGGAVKLPGESGWSCRNAEGVPLIVAPPIPID